MFTRKVAICFLTISVHCYTSLERRHQRKMMRGYKMWKCLTDTEVYSTSWHFVKRFWKSLKSLIQMTELPKGYLSSKSIHWIWRYHQLNIKKRVKLDEKAMWILVDFTRFLTLNTRYLQIQWIDFDAR